MDGCVLARVIAWLLESLIDVRSPRRTTSARSRSVNPASFFPSFLVHHLDLTSIARAMRTLCLQQLRRTALQTPARTFSTSAGLCRAFKEGDVVLLREKKDTVDGKLVKLQASKSMHTHRGVIEHANVIGKEPRQIVRSSKGSEFRVHEPTLAEYVRLTPRLVTPVRL